MDKEPFRFSYNTPSLDWYITINVEVKWKDYLYFKIQRRFGPSYWLLGYQKEDKRIKHREVEIGELSKRDLGRFVKWSEYTTPFNQTCSKLIGVSVISTGMNLFDAIKEIFPAMEQED